MTKICSKCKEEKSLSNFSKDSHKKSGIRTSCKSCNRNFSKQYYENNTEKEILRALTYNKLNPDKHALHSRTYYKNNTDSCRIRNREYSRKKMCSDTNYRLKKLLRDRFRKALKNNYKNGSAIENLGCSIQEFKKHLETKFQPGMSWDNFFIGKIHIDHIKPLCSFDLQNIEELKVALHYTNLQPLWAEDNLKKGSKYAYSIRD